MEIQLSFNTICYLMLYLANKKDNITQGKLIGRYIACIDPYNSALNADKPQNNDDVIKEISGVGNGFNSSAITNIMSKGIFPKFALSLNTRIINIPVSVDKFKKYINTSFYADDKSLLLFLILDLIKKDINNSTNTEDVFKEIFKTTREDFIMQSCFNLPELMVKIFLYTTSSLFNSDNRKEYIKKLREKIMVSHKKTYHMTDSNPITKYINELKVCKEKYFWDEETQTLTIVNQIDNHIEDKSTQINDNSVDYSDIKIENNSQNQLESMNNVMLSDSNIYDVNVDYVYQTCHSCVFWKKIDNSIPGMSAYFPFKYYDEGICQLLKEDKIDCEIACNAFEPKE